MPLTPSLKKRFVFKLAGNLAAVALGIVALAIATRALGPSDFGRFEFVTANFKMVLDTLTLQLPTAYFNWISRKGYKENTDYATGITFYLSAVVMALFATFICATTVGEINGIFWPDVPAKYLWLALGYSCAVFFYQLCIYLADGRALTVGLEKIRLTQNVIKTVGVLCLFAFGLLTLSSYFLIQTFVAIFSITVTAIWLKSRKAISTNIFKCWRLEKLDQDRFNKFTVSYIRPLIVSMLAGFAYLYFDRWFLQLIAGSSQQGYYALSERLGMVIFIFTSAMTPLITREYAFAHEQRDHARLVGLFDRIKIFVFIASAAGCFMSANSDALVLLFAGDAYKEAIVPVAIMMMYPIHQTLGQLSGALLLATGQTKLYANLAIAVMLFGAPFSYFLLAPNDFAIPGLALAATGLAIKMVLIQVVGVNIQLYYNTRFLGVSYSNWFLIQIKAIGVVYVVALTSHYLANKIPVAFIILCNTFGVAPDLFVLVSKLAMSGFAFAVIVLAFLWITPATIGVDKSDIMKLFGKRATLGV